jgi:phthiocerol/phenolphthiocerol synthesis type-I polyketide synthase E
MMDGPESTPDSYVAIIGMQGSFPGASGIEQFWNNLRRGVESTTHLSEHELREAGVAEEVFARANYVRANNFLPGVELFDADFFNIPAQEAQIIDPQQRIFLECAYAALEHAGYGPRAYSGLIGVYAGVGMNTYILANLQERYRAASSIERYQLMLANDKDFVSTRVSYKLNLRGPSMSINTACSTSLVAVHVACLSLLNGECDIALAGSASVRFPQVAGYDYLEGMIFSPDGRCRAFDASARGTILGDGVGVVVLKRYRDAVKDKDTVHAVIRGTAINNDGSLKTGYTAPSVTGQARVIAEAQDIAGVDPATVTYLEAHGTGTVLGDPVEIAGLTEAFRRQTDRRAYCALGSVKTNIGHLDVAAGMAGLIKTVLMLEHKSLVPSLNFEAPNPEIDFASSPFFVNTALVPWETDGSPRRAGVSSFGIGGTNAHVVLEEAPGQPVRNPVGGNRLVVLSARTEAALAAMTTNLAKYLRGNRELDLSDVAFTLAAGRDAHAHRCFAVCSDVRDAALTLALRDAARFRAGVVDDPVLAPVFVFLNERHSEGPGDRTLHDMSAVFRAHLDAAAEHIDLADRGTAEQALRHCAEQYAQARMWMHHGVEPSAMMGVGLSEYVIATLAGVFSLGAAIGLATAHVLGQRDRFARLVREIDLDAPKLPFLSGLTGTWIDDRSATDPDAWLRRMDAEVPTIGHVLGQAELGERRLLAIGGQQCPAGLDDPHLRARWLPPPAMAGKALAESTLFSLGELWLAGAAVDWERVYGSAFQRIPLPTYPFQRKRHWVEPAGVTPVATSPARSTLRHQLASESPHMRRDILVSYIRARIAQVRGVDAHLVDIDARFFGLGLTSLFLIELSANLTVTLDHTFPSSIFVEYPTIASVAEMILAALGLGAGSAAQDHAAPASVLPGPVAAPPGSDDASGPDAASGQRRVRQRLKRE